MLQSTSGSPETIENSIKSVRNMGKVCLVGVGPKINQQIISPSAFMSRGIWITSVHVSNLNLWFDLVNLMRRNKISFERVVTHRFPLDQVDEAFKLFDTAGKR